MYNLIDMFHQKINLHQYFDVPIDLWHILKNVDIGINLKMSIY